MTHGIDISWWLWLLIGSAALLAVCNIPYAARWKIAISYDPVVTNEIGEIVSPVYGPDFGMAVYPVREMFDGFRADLISDSAVAEMMEGLPGCGSKCAKEDVRSALSTLKFKYVGLAPSVLEFSLQADDRELALAAMRYAARRFTDKVDNDETKPLERIRAIIQSRKEQGLDYSFLLSEEENAKADIEKNRFRVYVLRSPYVKWLWWNMQNAHHRR